MTADARLEAVRAQAEALAAQVSALLALLGEPADAAPPPAPLTPVPVIGPGHDPAKAAARFFGHVHHARATAAPNAPPPADDAHAF